MKILQLNSSIHSSSSVSSELASLLSQNLLRSHPGSSLTVRDLALNPVSTYTMEAMVHTYAPEQNSAIAHEYNQLIEEIKNVDTLVIGAPMYNFSISVQLKAYFDAIAKKGETFTYTATGAKGLLNINKAYIILSRGGKYKEKNFDFQENFLTAYLSFIGVKKIEFIYAEGLNMGESIAAQAITEAREHIAQLV